MLTSLFIGSVNHLLGEAPWARQRLIPHAEGHARLEAGGIAFDFSIDDEGYLCECSSDGEADVCIAVTVPDPSAFGDGFEGLMRSARINGQVEMADSLGFVFRNLRWDVEGELARLVGDAAAHRIHQSGRRLVDGQKRAVDAAIGNLREYVAEADSPLIARTHWTTRTDRIRVLRDSIARLEKRVTRLGGSRRRN